MAYKVFLSLGSNMGDREGYLRRAIEEISRLAGTETVKVSSIYETDPVGYTEQDRFLNIAAAVNTRLEPLDMLEKLQGIEASLNRVRNIRWGPRTIDIDILLFGGLKLDLPRLTVPHPRMFERAFVLVPLKEVYPGDTLHGMEISELIRQCQDREGVKLYKEWGKVGL
ncbi:MAG: 2-amino-4-hydroxy-6-hydroxymethyldihydropteridine diphosphokinase [Clostridiales bacterium]|nr:2-amino-4-hydroxy-6-hydroxymethyldihydropteridine diphosphokinase [Eubacteriales bacterium]MDH7566117.1 2-amino-4-hydroxy-6-hydroxymethyldihydropteridine diphosphokinase [Clostridiales bacterium]